MKIAMVGGMGDVPPRSSGAIERHIHNISRKLTKFGHEVHVYVNLNKELRKTVEGYNIHSLKVRKIPGLPYLSRVYFFGGMMKEIAKKQDFDVVHSQVSLPAYSTISSLKNLKIPLIYTEHFWSMWMMDDKSGFPFSYRVFTPIGKMASKKLYTLADHLIFLSENFEREIRKRLEFDHKKISIIPNGVDTEIYNPKNRNMEIFERWNLNKEIPKILYVGRLSPEKGIIYLLQAFKEILRIYEVNLLIIGEGHQEKYLMEYSKKIGVEDKVIFAGNLEVGMLKRLYASCDIFCLPSLHEMFPLVILEAMASQIPIIATRTGGISETIESGKEGLLVPSMDSKALAKKIITLIEDKNLAKNLTKNAYKKVILKYSWNKVAREIEKVYQNLIH
ncbi:MAG: glycosyltransferase family 4 protein [Candidatus Methanofastidiosia archaeon]